MQNPGFAMYYHTSIPKCDVRPVGVGAGVLLAVRAKLLSH